MVTALRLCFFGDSFINGTGDPAGLGWVGCACASQRTASPDLTVYNLGVRGNTTAQINQRWQAEAEGLLRSAQAYARTVFIGPAPIADDAAADYRIASLCQDFAALAARLDLPYLPIHGFLRQHRSWMDEARAGDGAHPNAGGYAALADFIREWAALARGV